MNWNNIADFSSSCPPQRATSVMMLYAREIVIHGDRDCVVEVIRDSI